MKCAHANGSPLAVANITGKDQQRVNMTPVRWPEMAGIRPKCRGGDASRGSLG